MALRVVKSRKTAEEQDIEKNPMYRLAYKIAKAKLDKMMSPKLVAKKIPA